MENIFNLLQLFANTFGTAAANEITFAPATAGDSSLYSNDATDVLGRPYFMPVRLNGVILPYPVMSIRGKKTIVQTPLTRQNGTVKELISTNDYIINIKGLLIGTDGAWPEEDIKQLMNLYRMGESLSIESALTDLILLGPERGGSHQVVISSLSFPESKGTQHVTGYSMELLSDCNFELTLTN